MRLKVLTYNIHKGIGGLDRRYHLGRIVDVIRHYDPDVALLQEVDEGVPRSRGDRQVEELAMQLGFTHAEFQPNVPQRRGIYGNAILSRFPLEEAHDVELTVSFKKRRRAQVARLRMEAGGSSALLSIVNLHLGLAGFERRIQLGRLLSAPAISGLEDDLPCIVGGDFNDFWGAIGPLFMRPMGFRSAAVNVRTFPAVRPLRPLDAIYYRGSCEVHEAYAGRHPLTREASDHLPLIAELIVGNAPAE